MSERMLFHQHLPHCAVAHADDVDATMRCDGPVSLQVVAVHFRSNSCSQHVLHGIYLVISQRYNIAKTAPRGCPLVSIKRRSRNMECGTAQRNIIKRITTRRRHLLRIAIHVRQAAAITEGIVADAGHAVGDVDGCQAAAVFEGIVADAGHALRDGDGCQAAAAIEGTAADAGHALRDGDGCQAAAAMEGTAADAGHAVGDNCTLAANNQFIAAFLDDGIAVVTRIIYRVPFFYNNRCQAAAIIEGVAEAGHALRDGDGCQAAATREGT